MKRILKTFLILTLCCCAGKSDAANTQAGNNSAWASPCIHDLEHSAYREVPVLNSSVPLVWGDLKPDDFGPKKVTYDIHGMRKMPALPPVGVHPRVLFTREQLPDLRRRLKETRIGQHMWKAVIAWTDELKGQYDQDAFYTKPDLFKGSFGTHGFVPRFRANCLKQGEVYARYCRGETDFSDCKTLGVEWGIFPLEALRCLVEKDVAAGRKLGVAVEGAIKAFRADPNPFSADSPWGKWGIAGFNVAYTYDLAYQWLSPEAREMLRVYIAEQSCHSDHYGSFNPAHRSFSNWSTFTYPLVGLLAIEGEEGFNDLKYLGMLRSWRNFYTYGWYNSGACAEGMGKNQLGGDALVMFSLRGENIAGHRHALAYIRERIPRDVLPGDDRYLHFDRWGGLKGINTLDAMSMKYLYPDDPAIDWVFRKAVGWDDEFPGIGGQRLDHYWNSVLIEAVLADDPLPAAKQVSQEKAAVGSKTFFCGQRNLLSTRSDWSDDALFLNFQARPFNGGHVFADRNTFHFAGAGAYWFVKHAIAYQSEQNSVVIIDGKRQSPQAPARIVDRVDAPYATFVVGDAKYGWDWEVVPRDTWQIGMGIKPNPYTRLPRGGEWEPVWETSNDFSWDDTPEGYLNKPVYERIGWNANATNQWDMLARRLNLPVERAFRTAGIVRGVTAGQSYGLIVDDIQVDGRPHVYEWLGQLDDTTTIWKIDESHPGEQHPQALFTRDIYLFQPQVDGQKAPVENQPVLMVRLLDISMPSGKALNDIVQIKEVPGDKSVLRQLALSSRSVDPQFKVLLYPFRFGTKTFPETRWVGKSIEVSWPGGNDADQLTFTQAKSGKLNLVVRRGSEELAALTRPVPPSPDRTPRVDSKMLTQLKPVESWDFHDDDDLDFEYGKYDYSDAEVDDGCLVFTGKGHQQVSLPEVELPSKKNFTITFRVKTDKPGPCAIIGGDHWSFSLGHWNATNLKILEYAGGVRHTEEKIKEWFIDQWADVAIVKAGQSWCVYINGELSILCPVQKELPDGPLQIRFGDAAGNVAYGMLGRIDDVNVFDKDLSCDEILSLLGTQKRGRRR